MRGGGGRDTPPQLLFCLPFNLLIEAAAVEGIHPILPRLERTAVNMADGYTRVSNGRRIGVVATQAGAGIENAFAGVAQASADGTPLLLLPGGRQEPAPAPSRTSTRLSTTGALPSGRTGFPCPGG